MPGLHHCAADDDFSGASDVTAGRLRHPLTVNETRDLLEVIEDRCETHSTVIASQLPIENWHQAMPDPTAADAILDRLVHTAHKSVLRGESMRKHRATNVATSSKGDAK